MSKRSRQSGFALLLTLVLVMIAGIALTAVARQSSGEALRTREATEDLQRRWAVTSCQDTLLPRVKGLLTSSGSDRVECKLAGVDYLLVLTDEQAKYNPTLMLQVEDSERALRSALNRLVGGRSSLAEGQRMSVRLRPMTGRNADATQAEPTEDGAEIKHFGGFGQLFENATPENLLGTERRPGVAMRVTCWGDGRLKLRSAHEDVVEQVLGPVIGSDAVNTLVAARDASPGLGLKGWLDTLATVEPEAMALASAMLTDQSMAQGLWVVSEQRGRSWAYYSVRVHNADEPLGASEQQEPGDPAESDPAMDPPPTQRFDFAW